MLVTIVVAILGSSGLWALIQKKMESKSSQSKMLMGLAHDRIEFLAMKYLDRGFITSEEYENLYKYLYLPYKELGGNGSAERMVDGVSHLPIHTADYYAEEHYSKEKGGSN